MKQIAHSINNWLKLQVLEAQEFVIFMANTTRGLYKKPRYWHDFFDHMDIMGVGSIPIVLIAGGCIGALITLETLSELRTFGANVLLGKLTGLSIIRGSGPVFTAMIVSTRVSSSAAAELGTMQVSQQIDALVTMGGGSLPEIDYPTHCCWNTYVPALAIVNAVAAILTGALVAQLSGTMSLSFFLNQSLSSITPRRCPLGVDQVNCIWFYCCLNRLLLRASCSGRHRRGPEPVHLRRPLLACFSFLFPILS